MKLVIIVPNCDSLKLPAIYHITAYCIHRDPKHFKTVISSLQIMSRRNYNKRVTTPCISQSIPCIITMVTVLQMTVCEEYVVNQTEVRCHKGQKRICPVYLSSLLQSVAGKRLHGIFSENKIRFRVCVSLISWMLCRQYLTHWHFMLIQWFHSATRTLYNMGGQTSETKCRIFDVSIT